MELNIPKKHRDLMRRWLTGENSSADPLLAAIERAAPTLDPNELAREVSRSSNVEFDTVREFINVAFSFRQTVANYPEQDKAAALKSILQAVLGSTDPTPDTAQHFETLTSRIMKSKTIEVTAKAHRVIADNAHTFLGAKTLSEMRPVFSDDDLVPEAWVLLHQLKLTFATGLRREVSDIYLALDRRDLDLIQEAIQRAIEKHDKMAAIASSSNLKVL